MYHTIFLRDVSTIWWALMKLTDGTRAYNALRARLTREKQRGSSCLMLPVRSIREIVPPLDAELVKFFVLAASYGNEVGTAWAGQREFMSYGYRSDDVTAHMRALETVGLLRYVRQAQRDPVTRRFLPNVYQFNPALYFIRRRLRVEAASLSDRPFGAKSLILDSPSTQDRNQLVKPTTETSTKKPEPVTRKKNQQQTPFEEVEGRDSRIDPEAVRAANKVHSAYIDPEADAPQTAKTKAKRSGSGGSGFASAAGAKQNAPTPHSAPPPAPAIVTAPLTDPDDEAVAKRIKELGTHLPQARGLVACYGRDRIVRAYDPLKAAIDKGSVKNPIGLLRKWLDSGMFAEKDFEPVEWNRLGAIFVVENWDDDPAYRRSIRTKYQHLLDHPDCPDWFRERLNEHETSAAAD